MICSGRYPQNLNSPPHFLNVLSQQHFSETCSRCYTPVKLKHMATFSANFQTFAEPASLKQVKICSGHYPLVSINHDPPSLFLNLSSLAKMNIFLLNLHWTLPLILPSLCLKFAVESTLFCKLCCKCYSLQSWSVHSSINLSIQQHNLISETCMQWVLSPVKS